MKQLIQSFKTGETSLEEVPVPLAGKNSILVQTTRSLVSLGTERMLVEFGKASLIQKARQQPERIQQVLDKIKAEGLLPTLEAVFNKLEQPIPLGYCNVGHIVEVGEEVVAFQIGDRVVSNGPHAEFVSVPVNLAAKIPDEVSDDEAAFAIIGSVGLQGIRLANPTLGETVVVIGLGLIGLLTAQLLKANGCKVIGLDTDSIKVNLAITLGIKAIDSSVSDPISLVSTETQHAGADAVLITASSKSNDLIHQAALMSRKKGRIVLIGVVGLDLKRADFYEKELSFQVSCSYGPGRYDEQYEQKGYDYPHPFVRWTAKRNFESVLQCMAAGQVMVKPLITDWVGLEDFQQIYSDLNNPSRIASLLMYKGDIKVSKRIITLATRAFDTTKINAGIIGAGNFTKATLMPALRKNNVIVRAIASANGLSGTLLAKKYNVENSATDYNELLRDEKINLLFITTRHSQHAKMVMEGIRAGKNIFVEKPLAVNREELRQIITTYQGLEKPVLLHVGFNRRFSPHIKKIKSLVGANPGPLHLVITMNAGAIPHNHWVQDPMEGGRIIGEACHLVDLAVFIADSKVKSVSGQVMGQGNTYADDASFLLKLENGSNVVINYFANGARAYSKEKIELYYQGKTLIMDNFRVTTGFGWPSFGKLRTSIDKGHADQIQQLVEALKNNTPLIPFDSLVNVSAATLAMVDSIREGARIDVEY